MKRNIENNIAIPFTDIKYEDIDDIKVFNIKNITVYHITLKNYGGRCPKCGTYSEKVKEYKIKTIKHAQDIEIKWHRRRLICPECNATFYEAYTIIANGETKLSDKAITFILERLKRYNHTFSEVAQEIGVSTTKVIEVFDTHVQIPRKPLREIICIDEVHYISSPKRIFAFVIIGLNGDVLDVIKGRSQRLLLDYFKSIPIDERNKVKYVTMDLSSNYKEVIKRRFKKSQIVADDFHLTKLIYEALDKMRLSTMHKYESNKRSDEYYLLKNQNYLLFKDDIDLDKMSNNKHFHYYISLRKMKEMILDIDDNLTKAYNLKEEFRKINQYWESYTLDEIKEMYVLLIQDYLNSNITRFQTIANTIIEWYDEIINMYIPYKGKRLSNGLIENRNSYIKKLKHIANGYTNFDRFANRVKYVENLYDKPSEEKLENTIKKKKIKTRKDHE